MAGGVIVPLHPIDWGAAWLAPWRTLGEPLARTILAGTPQPQALNEARAAPVRFIPQADLPAGVAYEAHIFATGCVPTREGLHDFFNALVWMRFPQSKRRLNALQAQQITALGIAPERGAARDALTLLDENGALLHAPDALWEALVRKDWQALFGPLRPLWAQSRLVLFGHALTEKLVFPRKPITAHVLRACSATNAIADMDVWLSHAVSTEWLETKPFAHLPVLGVPGWWPGNEEAGFYEDAGVFRAQRASL